MEARGAWMAQTSGGSGSVVGLGWLGWAGKLWSVSRSKVSDGVRRKLQTEDDSSRAFYYRFQII